MRSPLAITLLGLVLIAPLLSEPGSAELKTALSEEPSFFATLRKQEYLTGDWGGYRTRLKQLGIDPYFTFTSITFTNMSGGLRTGSRWGGFMDFGADLSFEKMWGWTGGSFHLNFHWWQGDQPSQELIGLLGFDDLSGLEASNAFRLYHLYFQQEFQDGDYLFKIGQLNLDADFEVSDYAELFLNNSFGDMPSRAAASNAPVYPLAAPGLYFQAKPWKEWVVRTGVYTSDAGEDIVSNIGFDWTISGPAGFSILLEVALKRNFFGLPGTYKLGGMYSTAKLEQLGSSNTVKGNVDLYVVADQALLLDEKNTPLLGAFVRVGTNPLKDRTQIGLHAGAGLNWFGPISGRSKDTLGIAVSYNRFTESFIQSSLTDDQKVSKQETILEITYQAVLTPWLTLQPDIQFVFDPVLSRRNAYVFLMQAVVDF